MDNRTKGLIATIAAVVLCGCPGLFLCIFGTLTAAGRMPYNTELNGVKSSGTLPPAAGVAMLCLALILLLIPIVVGFLSLRARPAPPAPPVTPPGTNEPLPPAS